MGGVSYLWTCGSVFTTAETTTCANRNSLKTRHCGWAVIHHMRMCSLLPFFVTEGTFLQVEMFTSR